MSVFPLIWPAYVLAGGRSTRLGQDKARAVMEDDHTLIETVIDSLCGAFASFTVVAEQADKFEDLGLRTIADHSPDLGPLSGILRACEDTDSEYIFITSCDRIGLQCNWVARLADALENRPKAVSFVDDGHREPLFSFWRADLAPLIRRRLIDGQRGVSSFLDHIDAVAIEAPVDWKHTFSINTPDQLRRAREYLGKTDSNDLTSRKRD